MKILVTGGAGFIGSHLVEALSAVHWVDLFDNFNQYYDPAIKRQNIRVVLQEPSVRLIEGDIRDQNLLEEIFKKNHYEMVIHLAAMAGVRPSIEQPELYSQVNINGTQNLLECCRKYGVNKFIFASSSSIYGDNAKFPFAEDDRVDNPVSPYAATKKAGELLCYTYHYLFKIGMLCLRFFTVYGPRQRPDLAIHKFARLIKEGRAIDIYGDGTSARDYTYIDDIVSGLLAAIEYIADHDSYEIINLGESKMISLTQMVNILEKTIGKQAKRHNLESQPGDVHITYADITKAKKLLGYKPKVDFEDGIARFINWFNENKIDKLEEK